MLFISMLLMSSCDWTFHCSWLLCQPESWLVLVQFIMLLVYVVPDSLALDYFTIFLLSHIIIFCLGTFLFFQIASLNIIESSLILSCVILDMFFCLCVKFISLLIEICTIHLFTDFVQFWQWWSKICDKDDNYSVQL